MAGLDNEQRIFEGGEERKAELIASVPMHGSGDINRVIDVLRTDYYGEVLGYVPPLISAGDLNKYAIEALASGTIGPSDLPSTVFNREVITFPGTLDNFSASLVSLVGNQTGQRIGNPEVNPSSITDVLISADLITLGGDTLDTMQFGYTLFVSPQAAKVRMPREYEDFIMQDELRTHRPLFFNTTRVNSRRWRQSIWDEKMKQDKASGTATRLSRRNIDSPFQGGLPGTGRKY